MKQKKAQAMAEYVVLVFFAMLLLVGLLDIFNRDFHRSYNRIADTVSSYRP